MERVVYWPPRWAMSARRSLSLPAGAILMELFEQGTKVTEAKAAGGREFVVWNATLEELRACSSSSVHRAKVELLTRGYLIELPGARTVNYRPRSSWMVPVVLEEHASISSDGHHSILSDALFGQHHSISSGAPVESARRRKKGAEHHSISSDAPEHNSISSDAPPVPGLKQPGPGSLVRTRARGMDHHHQHPSEPKAGRNIITTSEISAPGVSSGSAVEDEWVDPIPPGLPNREELAVQGLRWARYKQPEQAVRRFGVERCLVALEALTGKFERNEYVGKPGGFVHTTLLALEGVVVARVSDVGFARWWLPAESAPNLVAFRRGGAR